MKKMVTLTALVFAMSCTSTAPSVPRQNPVPSLYSVALDAEAKGDVRRAIDSYVGCGYYLSAAYVAKRHDAWKEACDLFVLAGLPYDAARLAEEKGDFEKAYQLYEQSNHHHTAFLLAKCRRDFDRIPGILKRGRLFFDLAVFYEERGSVDLARATYLEVARLAEIDGCLNHALNMYDKSGSTDDVIRLCDRLGLYARATVLRKSYVQGDVAQIASTR